MSGDSEHTARAKAAETLLARIRTWWRNQSDLADLDRREIERIGAELGMTASDLRDLAARGPEAAALLSRRMKALGLARGDVERTALGLMRDLERTCSCCGHKGRCEHDLANRPGDQAWREYCPNAIPLAGVAGVKGRFLA